MRQKIRVALSGSGFLLPAHIGALRAIDDLGFEVVEYAGTSGGSIVAALAAIHMPLDELRDLAFNLNWAPMMSLSMWEAITLQGYCSGDKLLAFLRKLTNGIQFQALDVGLKIMASNIGNKRPYVFSKDTTPGAELAVAARSSASIPLIYRPMIIDEAILFDGGMVNNMAADILVRDDALRVGIDLISDQSVMLPNRYSLWAAAPRFIDMLLASSEDAHVSNGINLGARIIPIETGFASSLDRKMPRATRERLYEVGYTTTRAALRETVLQSVLAI